MLGTLFSWIFKIVLGTALATVVVLMTLYLIAAGLFSQF